MNLVNDAIVQCGICRFLTIGDIKKATRSIFMKQKSNRLLEAKKYGTVVSFGLNLLQYRHYARCSFATRGYSTFELCNVKVQVLWRYLLRNHSSTSDAAIYHAQLAWKRLFTKGCASGSVFYPISRIAQAVSLALT